MVGPILKQCQYQANDNAKSICILQSYSVPFGFEFDQEWVVYGVAGSGRGGEEGYLVQLNSLLILVGIQCSCCQSLFDMLGDYSGAAWEILNCVKCHCGENCLTYATLDDLPLQECRNSTYVDSPTPESAKTGINQWLVCHIYSDSITSVFYTQLVMKQGGTEGGQKSA